MKIALVGGTGREGHGMALRWLRKGHEVCIGSRDAARAQAKAEELRGLAGEGAKVIGTDNAACASAADVVVLCVPYSAHASTLESIKAGVAGKTLIDITVPLQPPAIRKVHLPKGQSAALEAQALLGPSVKVVAALHHVSSDHLGIDHGIDCDVLACSDDNTALDTALSLIRDLGLRAYHAGPLQNAVALESLTPVLLHLTKHYKGHGVGIRLTGIPG